MFSTPETSIYVLDKNREVSPLEREEVYGGKDLEQGASCECVKCEVSCEMQSDWTLTQTDLVHHPVIRPNPNISSMGE